MKTHINKFIEYLLYSVACAFKIRHVLEALVLSSFFFFICGLIPPDNYLLRVLTLPYIDSKSSSTNNHTLLVPTYLQAE